MTIDGHSPDFAPIIGAEFENVSAKRSRKSDVSAAPVEVRQGVCGAPRHAARNSARGTLHGAGGAGHTEVGLGEWQCVL